MRRKKERAAPLGVSQGRELSLPPHTLPPGKQQHRLPHSTARKAGTLAPHTVPPELDACLPCRYWARTLQHISQQKTKAEGELKTKYAALNLPAAPVV